MALSKRAEALKHELQQVLADKRELEAVEREWRELLLTEEERLCEMSDGELPILTELFTERGRLRKQLAVHQLQNWTRLQHLTASPLRRRILRLRYIQGRTWSEIIDQVDMSKQHILREHNKALEALAEHDGKRGGSRMAEDGSVS